MWHPVLISIYENYCIFHNRGQRFYSDALIINCDSSLSSFSCQGVAVIDSKWPTVTCCGTQDLSI